MAAANQFVPHLSNSQVLVLCREFDIAVYRIGDSCFKDTLPAVTHDKWFVSTLHDDPRLASDPVDIPDLATEIEAYRAAVHFLKLESLVAALEPEADFHYSAVMAEHRQNYVDYHR